LVTLDAKRVRESLQRLCAVKMDIFGAIGHRFLLNPTLTEADVSAFEQRHKVRLPADYRHFITAIGNGGAGPYYGVFPLGRWDGVGCGLETWQEADGLIGILSEPFLLTDKWNDLQGKPPDELLQTDEQEYEKQYDEFERRYWHSSLVNGAIPICHEGCALRIWLVLTGRQTGRLWLVEQCSRSFSIALVANFTSSERRGTAPCRSAFVRKLQPLFRADMSQSSDARRSVRRS
jgi:SMI1 / KNR4 family (SUKH-1)